MHSHHSFWVTMALSPFSLWVVAIIVGFTTKTSHGERLGSEVRYAKPVQASIFGLLMSASFLWVDVMVLWSSLAHDWPMLVVSAVAIWLFMMVGAPQQLTVDLNEKTYHIMSGWPGLQKHWNGSLQDAARIIVTYSSGNTSLIVHWKPMKRWKTQPPRFVLGRYFSRPQAEAAALRIMGEWNINVPVNQPGSRTEWLRKT